MLLIVVDHPALAQCGPFVIDRVDRLGHRPLAQFGVASAAPAAGCPPSPVPWSGDVLRRVRFNGPCMSAERAKSDRGPRPAPAGRWCSAGTRLAISPSGTKAFR